MNYYVNQASSVRCPESLSFNGGSHSSQHGLSIHYMQVPKKLREDNQTTIGIFIFVVSMQLLFLLLFLLFQ
jgi:hypothetical protein